MKDFLISLLEAILLIIFLPILILLFFFWVIPVVIVGSIKENRSLKEDKPKYNKQCKSCPHAEWCSEESASCDMYGGVD